MKSNLSEQPEINNDTKDQKSKQSTSEASKQDSTKSQDKMLRANAKMIFLTGVDLATRFQQIFIEQDHLDYKEALLENYTKETELVPTIQREAKRKRLRDIDAMVIQYKKQNEQLSNTLLNYVNGHLRGFNEEAQNKILNVMDTLYLLTIELNKSKNPSQMLSVCQLYNQGFFEKAFEEKDRMMEKAGLSVPTGIVDASGNKITSKR